MTITSYGQAAPAQDDTQRSYIFPNAKPAEAVEYVLGAAKDKVVQDNFFRPGAYAPESRLRGRSKAPSEWRRASEHKRRVRVQSEQGTGSIH